MTYKQIKTIWRTIEQNEDFDNEVNTFLENGWRLVRRELVQPSVAQPPLVCQKLLYAELERVEGPSETYLFDAEGNVVEVISNE